MASIRERMETVFAALAFAERNLPHEAQELLDQTKQQKVETTATAKRVDKRPRVRV
ncbi:MAG: hypothetical protein ACLGQH_01455 [Acidobacteriota bacterium]